MAHNLEAVIAVDTTQLSKVALAKSEIADLSRQVRDSANEMRTAGEAQTQEQKAEFEALVGQLQAVRNELAVTQAEMRRTGEASEAGFGKATEAVEAFHAKLQAVPQFFSAISELALGGLGVDKAFEALSGFGERGEMLAQLSEATGMTVEQLSALRALVIETGGDFDVFGRALPKFAEAMQTAVLDPGSKAASAFKALGVTVVDTAGRLRPTGDAFAEVGAKLASFRDDTNRAVIGADLFGAKLDTRVMPALLQLGQQGFPGVISAARNMGVLMGEEDVQQSEAFEKAVHELRIEIEGLEDSIAKSGAIHWLSQVIANFNKGFQILTNEDMARATFLNQEIGRIEERLKSGQGRGRLWGEDQGNLDKLKAEYDGLIAKMRAANQEAARPAQGEGGAEAPNVGAGDAKEANEWYQKQHEILTQWLYDHKTTAEQAIGIQRSFWEEAVALAKASGYTEQVAKIEDEVLRLRGESARAGISDAKREAAAQQFLIDILQHVREEETKGLAEAKARAEEALSAWQKLGDKIEQTTGDDILGAMTRQFGDIDTQLRRSAEEVQQEWSKLGDSVGSSFSDGIMSALEGKKGGLAKALDGMLRSLLGDGLKNVGKSLFETLVDSIGASDGHSPSSLLGSLLGTGGAGGFLGNLFGGKSLVGDATKNASETANTAAVTANTGAIGTLDGSTGILDTSMALLQASVDANTTALGANSWAKALPGFAAGGIPPVGVPSIVGERGPELFVPHSAGTVIPNNAFSRLSGGGGDTYHIHAPASYQGGARMSDQDVDDLMRRHGGRIEKHIVNRLKNRAA
jgi:hypothetical protein